MSKKKKVLRNHLTDPELEFVRANYRSIAIKQMAKQLNIPFSRVHETMQFYGLQPNSARCKAENYIAIEKREQYFDVDAYFEQYYF